MKLHQIITFDCKVFINNTIVKIFHGNLGLQDKVLSSIPPRGPKPVEATWTSTYSFAQYIDKTKNFKLLAQCSFLY